MARKLVETRSLVWLGALGLTGAAAVGLFFVDDVGVESPYLRLWTLRLGALALASLFAGIVVRNATVKSILFSVMAVFAALAVVEAYLAHQDEARKEAIANAIVPEFADEYRRRRVEPTVESRNRGVRVLTTAAAQEIQAAGKLVGDRAEVQEVFRDRNRVLPDHAILVTDASVPDPILGYGPIKKESTVAAVRKLAGEVVYSVLYSLGPDGWRVTPQRPEARNAVVFLGDSFTFGEGLDDEDTYVYKVAGLLGEDTQVFNFAYSGYGTHQALAMVQNGYLDDIARNYDTMRVFYMSLPAHGSRAMGKAPWDQDGPAYEIAPDGGAVLKGTFRDVTASGAGAALLGRLGETKAERETQLALIRQLNRDIQARYQTSLVVLEPFYQSEYLKSLTNEGVVVLQLLPNPKPQHSIRGDGHPSALATTVFAEDIARYLGATVASAPPAQTASRRDGEQPEAFVSQPEALSILKSRGLQVPADALPEDRSSRPDRLLGYRSLNGPLAVTNVRKKGSEVIYAAFYTVNSDGWRITPSYPEAPDALIFMGDSFTFGVGVNDTETYAYRVGALLGGKYQTFNYAYRGWGPHQALALIENGALDPVFEKYRNATVFFLTIPHHMDRAAGEVEWDTSGPCYRFTPDGDLVYRGSFTDATCVGLSGASRLLARVEGDRAKKALVLGIFRKMQQRLEEKYGARLIVLEPFNPPDRFLEALQNDNIPVVSVMSDTNADYTIPGDGHPSPAGHEAIARTIVRILND